MERVDTSKQFLSCSYFVKALSVETPLIQALLQKQMNNPRSTRRTLRVWPLPRFYYCSSSYVAALNITRASTFFRGGFGVNKNMLQLLKDTLSLGNVLYLREV